MFRLNEAIARAATMGLPVSKKVVAARLWPDQNLSNQQVKMTRLCAGRTLRIKAEWVPIICEMCKCSADYLFGIEK